MFILFDKIQKIQKDQETTIKETSLKESTVQPETHKTANFEEVHESSGDDIKLKTKSSESKDNIINLHQEVCNVSEHFI